MRKLRGISAALAPFIVSCGLSSALAADSARLTPAQMREDLLYLRDVYLPRNKSFDPEKRKDFERVVADALSKVDALTPAGFALEISRALAVARNGHSSASLDDWFHSLPIRMAWFSDGLYVVRAHPRFPELLGVRIEKFGHLTSNEALARAAPFISGADQRIRDVSPTYLRLLEVLHRIGASSSATQVALTVRARDGRKRVVKLTRQPSFDPDSDNPWLDLIPTDKDVPGRWLHVLDTLSKRPQIYQRPTDFHREWWGDESGTLYIRSNQIWGSDGNRYSLADKLIDLLQSEVVPRRPKNVIVDLRLNYGGDFFNTILFAQSLPKLIPEDGKILVLVGRSTFSAALVTAAMLKGYGGDRAMLVGEPMGDRNPFWAEGKPFSLPNSKITVTSAERMHDWSRGCDDLTRCYWANMVFAVKGTSLEPEVEVAATFAEYAAGRDPVLEAALTRAR